MGVCLLGGAFARQHGNNISNLWLRPSGWMAACVSDVDPELRNRGKRSKPRETGCNQDERGILLREGVKGWKVNETEANRASELSYPATP